MYLITAVEIDEITGDETGPKTSLKVDKTGQVRELQIVANGSGLTSLPQWDLMAVGALLLADQTESGTFTSAAPPAPVGAITEAEPTLVPPTPAPRKRAAKATTAKAVRAPAKQAAPKPSAAPTDAADEAAGEGTPKRSYRKMPEPELIIGAWGQVGTVTGLADHFGVPRHTATGWVRRLRKSGVVLEGASTE